MQAIWVILASLLYAGMLFAVAWLGDRHARALQSPRVRPLVYSLALAVYCSSWTFYGAVGTAARYGLGYLPIYLGPLLMFALGWRMLERLALVAKNQNTVSIADFLASRFGRSPRLAALVTVISLLAAVPYLALQYKAVAASLRVMSGIDAASSAWGDPAFYVAVIMALFAILFGTRQVDATEHRPGLMLAVALESLIKLLALLAVGVMALGWFSQRGGSATQAIGQLVASTTPVGFWAQTLLAFAAIICLPRQFHVAIVECGDAGDIRRARWWFGAYLALISLMVLPIAAAGLAQFGAVAPITVAPDSFVLALPLAAGHEWLALVAYIGGFSAATGMVVVVSVALSNMVSNDLVMPLLLSRRWRREPVQPGALAETGDARDGHDGREPDDAPGTDPAAPQGQALVHTPLVLWVRRAAIVVLAMLAYAYSRGMGQQMQLASLGLMAFAAVAQFGPALVAGLYWQGASRRGVKAGLAAGFAVWAYTLLLPSLAEGGWMGTQWVAQWVAYGPLEIAWLRPYQLFGTVGWDSITHATFWSLLANVGAMLLGSLRWRPSLAEQMQARPFLAPWQATPAPDLTALAAGEALPWADNTTRRLKVQDLQWVASQIVGAQAAQRAFEEHAQAQGQTLAASQPADRAWLHFTELLLTGAVGAASARLVMTRALQGAGMELAAIVSALDEAGQELRFNRDILLAMLEHIDPGISVVDAQMRLVAWNRPYEQLFQYPSGMLYVGRDVGALIRYNLQHNPLGLPGFAQPPADMQAEVDKRVALMRAGRSYTYVRELRDGRYIEMRGHPLPHGGYVTSYSDISDFKQAERELRNINETLEQRVAERSQELAAAHESRSRYLTAISHDVLQPVHAARLFAAALREEQQPQHMRHLAERVDASLNAAEDLLDGVLDISRLDAGAMRPQWQRFAIVPMLRELHAQYAPLAAQRQLQWRLACSQRQSLIVHSDPRLLRRVLQNFVANALRYTQRGGILLSARIQAGGLLVQVWDTGPGIPEGHLARIYEEFHRYQQVFDWDGRGLGLGLSICQRIGRLLDHPLSARSITGRGSVFAIAVPLVEANAPQPPDHAAPASRRLPGAAAPGSAAAPATAPAQASPADLKGMTVLCLDNDPEILQGMQTLLTRWGVQVRLASSVEQALQLARQTPRLHYMLLDYHLHESATGLDALALLRAIHPRVPAALVTADGSDELKQKASQRDCAVLTKPLKPATLRALLMAYAAGHSDTSASI
ncbi:response regulator [Allofranklinella schreckenbergeri]|uniref:histidine kinase n=1 Tax=Allofranklinella schreckenbergeri TaxID=1076744 RepID=A0A3M6Q475_9BURK|nr:PAS-domain containing protein [Allofranklinella schreckenbergeri]RMW94611.1 response regulator [Allofranklinella schreckenbergeri]RMW97766.1 response regulator [Allofranklinella schreckenbergeri]